MAIDFNGTTDRLDLASTPVTAVPLTLFARINVDTTTGNGTILAISKSTTDNNAFFISTLGDKVTACTNQVGDFHLATTTAAISVGPWFDVCGVFSAADSRTIYLNGGNAVNGTEAGTPSGLDSIQVGVLLSGLTAGYVSFLNGRIAEPAIWNVALTAAEVASLSSGFSPLLIRPASLVRFSPLIRELQGMKGGISYTATGTTVADHPRVIMPKRRG